MYWNNYYIKVKYIDLSFCRNFSHTWISFALQQRIKIGVKHKAFRIFPWFANGTYEDQFGVNIYNFIVQQTSFFKSDKSFYMHQILMLISIYKNFSTQM